MVYITCILTFAHTYTHLYFVTINYHWKFVKESDSNEYLGGEELGG